MRSKLRFPVTRICDVAPMATNRVSQFDGLKPYVATADVQDGQIVNAVNISFDGKPSRADISVKDGDLIFARMVGTRKVLMINSNNQQNVYSTGFAVLRPTSKVNPNYLKHWLTSDIFNEQKDLYCTGTTQKAISNSSIEKLSIPLPPLDEQKRIARLLDDSELMKIIRQKIQIRMAQFIPSLFTHMFGNLAVNERKWQKIKLRDMCSEIYRYPTFYGFDYIDKGIPVIRIGNILESGIVDPDISNYVFISHEVAHRYPRTTIEINDILMAVRGDGSTGKRIGIVNSENLIGANMSPNLLRFKANTNTTNAIFLYYLLVSDIGQKIIESKITRTAKKTITARDLASIEIPHPPLTLQSEFAMRVSDALILREKQSKLEIKISALYQSMLAAAFEGNL